jgi:hypothetical protein
MGILTDNLKGVRSAHRGEVADRVAVTAQPTARGNAGETLLNRALHLNSALRLRLADHLHEDLSDVAFKMSNEHRLKPATTSLSNLRVC